jgi:hypothetical protein
LGIFVLLLVGDAQLPVLLDEKPAAGAVDDQGETVAFGLTAVLDCALQQPGGAQAQDRVALRAGQAVRAWQHVYVDAWPRRRELQV